MYSVGSLFLIEFLLYLHSIGKDRARKKRGRLATTPCLFTARHQDPDDIELAPEGEEQEDYFTPTTSGESIQFRPWVNKVKINNY